MITSGAAWTADAGLFGKLPARGDFVQLGLPGSFVRPWDAWLQQAMAGSQERLGDAWLPAFLEAPVWRFVLPGGMCGAGAVLGLLMPSVDRVGRYYPLTLAAVLPPGRGVPRSDIAEPWLEACEAAGRAALDEDATPDQVVKRLPQLRAGDAAEVPRASEWWTAGGPRVPAMRLEFPALPDAVQFAAILGSGLGDGLGAGLGPGIGDGPGPGLGDGLGPELGPGAPAQAEA
jgi:type VI secretion system protein ImpM